MTTHAKTLEELIKELPPHGREEVRNFVEFLLSRQGGDPSSRPDGDSKKNVRQFFGAWDSGDENSGDNERIDADLAREYESTHEGES